MPKRPGEKVILIFKEVLPERYEIIHLNKPGIKISHKSEKISADISIADYWLGKDRPQGHLIGKFHALEKGVSDVLVVSKGNLIEEKIYNIALKYAQDYAMRKGLKFEDQSNFIQDPFPYHPPSCD